VRGVLAFLRVRGHAVWQRVGLREHALGGDALTSKERTWG